jgi:mannose/cellobiose epimerase-like protein (N-acyl-D-glucosamine 2-epimerase family)
VPLQSAQGEIVEPGHQFEWAWILGCASKMFALDLSPQIRRLIWFGERHGVNPITHMTYNKVMRDGSLLDGGSRIWPNTERLKAAVAAHEVLGCDSRAIMNATLELLFDRYLSDCPKGGWIDALDADGHPIPGAMPTSTFYHLFLAFAEVIRIREAMQAT